MQYLREGTQPECDPELLESLRGTPLAEVDLFLEGLTVTHALAAQMQMVRSSAAADAAHERYSEMVSRAVSRVGYSVTQQPASQPDAPEENLLVLRRAGQMRRYEVLCAIPMEAPLHRRGDAARRDPGRPGLPGPVRRADSTRRRDRDGCGGAHHRARAGRRDHRRRPRGSDPDGSSATA